MKKMHIHIRVENLQQNHIFYSKLFGANPVVIKEDYMKWEVDELNLNFSITEAKDTGIEHLGIQVADSDQLSTMNKQLKGINGAIKQKGETVCCYAKSEKIWVLDPQGIEWEIFHTYGQSETFYDAAL